MIRTLFEFVDAFPSSVAWRESLNGYVYLLTAHVVSMGLVAGVISYWDMRLAGMALKWIPVSKVQSGLFPWLFAGTAVNAGTGIMLVYSQPMRYFGKLLYWIKMGLIVLAGVNAMLFHFTTYRSIAKWDTTSPPLGAKVAGVLSLAMWACIVAFGRLTAYDYDWATFE